MTTRTRSQQRWPHSTKLYENCRRSDPVQVILEATGYLFVFVAYTDPHHRVDDELEYEVGHRSVTGNMDRSTFLFRKP